MTDIEKVLEIIDAREKELIHRIEVERKGYSLSAISRFKARVTELRILRYEIKKEVGSTND